MMGVDFSHPYTIVNQYFHSKPKMQKKCLNKLNYGQIDMDFTWSSLTHISCT
jgi:hypothetical protein